MRPHGVHHAAELRGHWVTQVVHDGGEGKPAGHHTLVVPSYDVFDGERVFEGAGLRARDAPVALKVREATHAGRRGRVLVVAGRGAQLAAGMVVVMVVVEVVHHGGALAGHVLSAQHLEALPSPEEAAVFEHVPAVRVQSPEAAFPGLVGPPRDLDEAVVKGEVVSQGVLPPLGVLSVIREPVHNELVDVTQRQHLLGRVLDCHGCQ